MQENFDKLFEIINSFSDEEKLKDFIFDNNRDKNIRDILVYLHEWHLMMLNWYEIGMNGGNPEKPAKGYTFKTIKSLNRVIWEKYQNTTFKESIELINKSFLDVRNIIKSHSDEELFTKQKYKWTETTSIGSYLVSATASHYDWGIKMLKQKVKFLKTK